MTGPGRPWQVWVDTGGTFTDCLALSPAGELRHAKVLSTSALRARVAARVDERRLRLAAPWRAPEGFFAGGAFRLLAGEAEWPVSGWTSDGVLELEGPAPDAAPGAACEIRSPEEAPVLAARLAMGVPAGRPLPPLALRLATTLGTNALLERRGAPTAFFVTRGFGDLLRIGNQQRPDLFALAVRRPEPLYAWVFEVAERLAADGSVLEPLDLDGVLVAARAARAAGAVAAAVALLHSYREPRHEEAVAAALSRAGFAHVSASARLSPTIRLLPRAETAVVDAYLAPLLAAYLERVRAGVAGATLHVMTSAGGLVGADEFRPKDGLLSGPAGGVVGAAAAAALSGRERLIAFDMGGTSTDVARFDGDFDYAFEHQVADAHLAAPALAIESVAAGGGSICRAEAGSLAVGPQSAGAHPGPACYGAGGPLTLTDVNLLLGRLDPEGFEIPIDPTAAERALQRVMAEMGAAVGEREALLTGFLAIADETMAEAIRRISVRRGYDPAGYALVAFGGAGGQHACAVAGLLGIATVLVPRHAGLLSALGLGCARLERFAERQVLRPLDEVAAELPRLQAELEGRAVAAVAAEGAPRREIAVRRRILGLRLVGQDTALAVEPADGEAPATAFAAAYRALYGYPPPPRPIELESLRVVASTPWRPPSWRDEPVPAAGDAAGPEARHRAAFLDGGWRELPVHPRAGLAPGRTFAGPALFRERHSAVVLEPGWTARVDAAGALILERAAPGGPA